MLAVDPEFVSKLRKGERVLTDKQREALLQPPRPWHNEKLDGFLKKLVDQAPKEDSL